VADADFLLGSIAIYVEGRVMFATINAPQDGAKRLTIIVGIFEH
jgi:hypothetical protein